MRLSGRCILLSVLTGSTVFGCTPFERPEYIRDEHGRIVIYHGVCVSNYSKHAEDHLPWHTRADFAKLNDWGFNLVRFQVFWDAIEPERGVYDGAYIDAVIERIGWLDELGVDVILDLHQDLYARRFTGNGFPEWTIEDDGIPFTQRQPWNLNYIEPAVLAGYKNFWASEDLKRRYVLMMRHLLERVDRLPNLLGVEIMNEPWPSPLIGFEQTVLTEFYDAVREMHTNAGFTSRLCFEPVIYTSTGVASSLRFKPESGSIYCAHYYDPFCHEGFPYTEAARFVMRAGVELRAAEARDFGTALIYDEFGISPSVEGFQQYLDDFTDLMDEYHLGWTYWCYDSTLYSGFGFLDENRQVIEGLLDPLVYVYPQYIAGRNPNWACAERGFELSYDPIAGDAPTVVFVPSKLTGISVSVNGEPVAFDSKEQRIIHKNNDADARQTIRVEWE